jgi:hypothetical protein
VWSAVANAGIEASDEMLELDLSAVKSYLTNGENLLAIRLFNSDVASDDAFLQFELIGESRQGPPIAVDDSISLAEDQTVTIPLLANDIRGEHPIDAESVAIASPPAHGSVTANADGTVLYAPHGDYFGTDSFTYFVKDESSLGTETQAVTLVESTAPVRALVPTSDALGTTWRGGNEPFNDATWPSGTFGVGYDASTAFVDFTPYLGLNVGTMQNVTPSVYMRTKFTVDDPAKVAALTLRMRADDGFAAFINGTRVASSLAPTNLTYNSQTTAGTPSDADGLIFRTYDASSFISALLPGENVLAIHGLNQTISSSDLIMQPELIASVRSGGQRSNSATVTVSVSAVPDAPRAANDTYVALEGTELVVAGQGVLANDADPDSASLTAVVQTLPANGRVSLDTNGRFTYTPSADFVGTDTFTYIAGDGDLWSEEATVSIDVRHLPPTANADVYAAIKQTALLVGAEEGVLANDTDSLNLPLLATLATPPTHGSISLRADGGFTYLPNSSFEGLDSFSYRATGGGVPSAPATVSIDVRSIPVATPDTYTAFDGETLTVDLANAREAGPGRGLEILANAGRDINRYDAYTGEYRGRFTRLIVNVDNAAWDFGPNGDMYVVTPSSYNQIDRYDGHTGQFIDSIPIGSASEIHDIAFGPDGNIYVSDQRSHSILKFDPVTGSRLASFDPGSSIIFRPKSSDLMASRERIRAMRLQPRRRWIRLYGFCSTALEICSCLRCTPTRFIVSMPKAWRRGLPSEPIWYSPRTCTFARTARCSWPTGMAWPGSISRSARRQRCSFQGRQFRNR